MEHNDPSIAVVAIIKTKFSKKNEMENKDKSSDKAHSEPLQQCSVSGSALYGYRFKITSNINNSVLGTGFMTASKTLDETEQMDLFHSWTHGKYLRSENYVSVSVFQADR
jgi:hypothetical protein